MKTGRPRKPTKLKIIEGNRGKRKIKPEPEPTLGIPDAPPSLTKRGADVWERFVPELDRLGLLTKVDGTSLVAACNGAGQGEWADAQMEKLQSAKRVNTYRIMMLNAVSKKGWQQWRAFCTEFGLTPASRSKLAVPERKQEDPIDEALFA